MANNADAIDLMNEVQKLRAKLDVVLDTLAKTEAYAKQLELQIPEIRRSWDHTTRVKDQYIQEQRAEIERLKDLIAEMRSLGR